MRITDRIRKNAGRALPLLALLAVLPAAAHAASLGDLMWIGHITVQGIIGRVIRTMFGVAGTLALVMFMYGGFTWITAAGNEEKIKKAKNTVVWTALGLVAMAVAYAIVNLIIIAVSITPGT